MQVNLLRQSMAMLMHYILSGTPNAGEFVKTINGHVNAIHSVWDAQMQVFVKTINGHVNALHTVWDAQMQVNLLRQSMAMLMHYILTGMPKCR